VSTALLRRMLMTSVWQTVAFLGYWGEEVASGSWISAIDVQSAVP
jgi:hypothetical protein